VRGANTAFPIYLDQDRHSFSQRSMRSTKRLRSVVHSTAHHAMSGVCYVHPHLGEARKRVGAKRVSVDLLQSIIAPALDPLPREIELSTNALRERFSELWPVSLSASATWLSRSPHSFIKVTALGLTRAWFKSRQRQASGSKMLWVLTVIG
jgi:hypothetical protein